MKIKVCLSGKIGRPDTHVVYFVFQFFIYFLFLKLILRNRTSPVIEELA